MFLAVLVFLLLFHLVSFLLPFCQGLQNLQQLNKGTKALVCDVQRVTPCLSPKESGARGFPDGPVVKNLPCNAEVTGSISGRGTKIPHASGQLSPSPPQAEKHKQTKAARCKEDPAGCS